MKQMLINSMVSFTLGTGASLIGLYSWLGTTDLQAIRSAVVQLDSQAESQAQAFVENYTVTVDNANAEIGAYEQALEKANGNINKLISAYQQAEEQHQKELAQAEQDLSDLQVELGKMQTRLDSQYEQDMNAIIEQANAQINQANQEVGETKAYVDEVLENSRTNGTVQDRIADTGKVLDTGNNKSVVEITDIVGE